MDVAARFSSVGELAAAIAAMAGSILLAFWRRPLPFVPEDVRRAGAFQIARLAVSFVVVVLVFAGSRYLAENWVWFALGSVILAGLGSCSPTGSAWQRSMPIDRIPKPRSNV